MSQRFADSIFWIETDKIKPNPFQPRREFNEGSLNDLADSIRQYGILQPLVVTRTEIEKEDGGIMTEYELIAGERRLRASKIAGVDQVPVIIRIGEQNDQEKLELAIIENLQREDLNPIDKARAFKQLAEEFGFKHTEIAKKVGRSRESVSNSIRLLSLPDEVIEALSKSAITEGHARPIMMLAGRPEEQITLFKEVIYKKLTVREAEAIARRIAYDKVRKKEYLFDPELVELEEVLSSALGTRVQIEKKDNRGKITIDFFSNDDLRSILNIIEGTNIKSPTNLLQNYEDRVSSTAGVESSNNVTMLTEELINEVLKEAGQNSDKNEEKKEEEDQDDDLYSIKNFSI